MRRYHNLVEYQLRPMLNQRNMPETTRIQVLKRIVQQAGRFKYESGVVAGSGTREELFDLLTPYLRPEAPTGEEYRDWIKRAIRSFGASIESEENV